MERTDQADEGRVQLSIRQVRTDAHARAGAVAVVRCSCALGIVEIALWEEGVGVFEVRCVVVRCPCVLYIKLIFFLVDDCNASSCLPYKTWSLQGS